MKQSKRWAALLLLCALVLGLAAGPVSAADPAACPFEDIYGVEYEEDIIDAYALGLMNGMSLYQFQPDGNMSRAMFVVTLFRAHRLLTGDQAAYTRPRSWPFTDVKDGRWYSEAIYWALSEGITNGIDSQHFAPNKALTKEQAATFLYRYEKAHGSHLGSSAYLGGCSDASQVSDYARRPLMWLAAIDSAQIRGTQISPKSIPCRAELAHMLVNYYRVFTAEGDVVVRPEFDAIDLRLCILGIDAPAPLWFDGALYLALDEQTRALYEIEAEAISKSDMQQLELAWQGRSLTLTDSFPDARINGKKVSLSAAPVVQDGVWYLPVGAIAEALGWNVLEDAEDEDAAQVFIDKTVNLSALPAGRKVAVLEYHGVSDDLESANNDSLYISPLSLREEILWLLNQGYTFITFEDLDRLSQISKPVLLTFDDGYENNYTELFPILRDYNVKATVFVVARTLDTDNHLTTAQLQEMQESGLVSIQSHSYSHSNLTKLSGSEVLWECQSTQLAIARITGHVPFVLSYPYGKMNDSVEAQARKVYQFGVCVQRSPYGYITGNNPYRIYRHEVVRGTTLAKFKSDFNYWIANMK